MTIEGMDWIALLGIVKDDPLYSYYSYSLEKVVEGGMYWYALLKIAHDLLVYLDYSDSL